MSRFNDIAGEPLNQILPPISGYEHVPVVGLKEAIQPVSHLFNGIDWYVWVAIEHSLHPADGLTSDESASIYLYTMTCSNGPSVYEILNQHLRSDNRETVRPWFSYLRLFLTGLRKLPSRHCTVWRGIQNGYRWMHYPTGGHLVWWGVSSCATTPDILESTEDVGDKVKKTFFSIECQNAKLITAHSRDRDMGREEFILLPGTCFEVMNQVRGVDASIVVYLREIESISPASSVALNRLRIALEPNREEIERVVSYLDVLYPNGQTINPFVSTDGDTSTTYKPEVIKFFELIADWCYNLDFGYMSQFMSDPSKIATANFETLKQLLVLFTRQERNGPHGYSRAIEYGHVKRILLRMKELFPYCNT